MIEYPHIETVFKRQGDKKPVILGKWSFPEFEYLKHNTWLWTEKVNGQNIRVNWVSKELTVDGRTDEADLREDLLDFLGSQFTKEFMLAKYPDTDITLYGEGYGGGIVDGSGLYKPDGYGFVLFDVRVLGKDKDQSPKWWWLRRPNVEDVAKFVSVDIVPVIREGTLIDAIEFARAGFKSAWGLSC